MLLLSEHDDYWRGRRECQHVTVEKNYIYSRWLPWADVVIDTWLVALDDWQVRIHHLKTGRDLTSVEGGFSLISRPQPKSYLELGQCWLEGKNETSAIFCLSEHRRDSEMVMTPPNSNLLFADRATIPVLRGQLSVGEHLLISAVWAGGHVDFTLKEHPEVNIDSNEITLVSRNHTMNLTLIALP